MGSRISQQPQHQQKLTAKARSFHVFCAVCDPKHFLSPLLRTHDFFNKKTTSRQLDLPFCGGTAGNWTYPFCFSTASKLLSPLCSGPPCPAGRDIGWEQLSAASWRTALCLWGYWGNREQIQVRYGTPLSFQGRLGNLHAHHASLYSLYVLCTASCLMVQPMCWQPRRSLALSSLSLFHSSRLFYLRRVLTTHTGMCWESPTI